MIAATAEGSVVDEEPAELEPSLGVVLGAPEGLVVEPAVGAAVPETVGTAADDTSYRPISAPATPMAKAANTPSATNSPEWRRRRGGGGGTG